MNWRNSPCKVEGCNRRVGVKKAGLCLKHYDQMRHQGKITPILITDPNTFIVEGATCKIVLRDKKQNIIAEALIDVEDLVKVKKYKWGYSKGYAFSKQAGLLHVFLLPNVPLIDHINRNRLDNRKHNLRPATISQNGANAKLTSRSTSGFKGVSYFKRTGSWRAYITVNKKFISLGYYKTPEEAAQHYDAAALKHFGTFARTNKDLGLI